MNRILLTTIFFIIIIFPLKAQYPWEKITNIDYPIKEVFKVDNYLIGYSARNVLLSENQSNFWEVIEGIDGYWIYGLAYSDSLFYILLQDSDFNYKIAHLTISDLELSINQCVGIGPDNGSGYGIADIIFKDGFLFAGNNNGRVYRSADGGLNWYEFSNGLITGYSPYCNHQANGIYKLYSDGDKLFVGTRCFGIYSSDNNGDIWQESNTGIPMETKTRVYDISGNYEKIYAMTEKGVYFSVNTGGLWHLDDNLPYGGHNIEINENNLCIPTTPNIYISNDNGTNWDIINQNLSLPLFSYNNFITSDSNYFFIADKNYGMYKLLNVDTILENYSYGITHKHAKYLFKEDSLLLSATESKGLYYSYNSGDYWDIIESALVNIDINAIEKFDTLLIAATDSGIYSSSDIGIQWTKDISFYEFNVNSIISYDGNLYAGTNNGIYKGNIGSWNEFNSGITDIKINYLYAYENYLYSCTNNGAYLLDADTQEWSKIFGIPDESIISITQNNSRIFVALNESIYYSENEGVSWSITTINGVNSINFLTNLDTNVFAVTDKGIYSFQSNEDWLNLYIDHNSYHLVVSDSLLLASTEHGIYKTIFNESLILGLDNIDNNNFIDIYPNPFSSILNLKVVELASNQINIFNMSGRLEYSVTTKPIGSDIQLDLGNLKNGIYTIQINDGKSIITRKIIKVNN